MEYPLTWSLTELGPEPGTQQFDELIEKLQEGWRKTIAQAKDLVDSNAPLTAEQLQELVGTYSQARADYWQARSLVSCWAAADTTHMASRQAEADVAALSSDMELGEHLLGTVIAKPIDDEWAKIIQSEGLAPVSGFLIRRRTEAANRIPDHLAELAGELSVDGLHAWSRLYDTFSGDLKIKVMEKGEVVEKSPAQVAFDSPDRSERQNNFYSSQRAWKSVDQIAASTLNHLVGSRLTLQKHAGLESHLTIPSMQNRISVKAIETMWQTIEKTKPLVKRYLGAKQKLLGISDPAWYDLDAPLQLGQSKVTYDDACRIILESFEKFHPRLAEFSAHALKNRWIEVENRSGKRQGGFCIDFPNSEQTRIFMTYRDTEDGLSTLAHELGHAYHGWVLRKHPVTMQIYPMSLAETASTFAETIVAEQRLAASTSPKERLDVLDRQLNDAVAFLMNIHCRYIFENQVHERRPQGELTADELHELMVGAQKEAYQNVLCEDGWNPTFWISKLHFYISDEPFYNFPYTVGYLLSQYLFQEAQQSSEKFDDRYDQFLIATGGPSAREAVMDSFNCDIETSEFWEQALSPVSRRVEEFERIAKEL